MKVVIERKKWARGGENGDAQLLNSEGNMCCLGFCAVAVGIPEHRILLADTWPIGTDGRPGRFPRSLSFLNRPGVNGYKRADDIAHINDTVIFKNDTERESQLLVEFAKHGIEVEFK